MTQQIQVGNDTLEFPDDMPDDQIVAVIQKEYGQGGQAQAPQTPIQPGAAPIQETAQEPLARTLLRPVGQFAMGLPNAFGNALIGGVQAGADVGDKAIRLIDKIYFGESLAGQKLFGERLADQVKLKKEAQAKLPVAERAGIAIGEIVPFLTTGAATGAKVAAATGSKIAGLAAGSGVSGAVASGLSAQEEAGLENRATEALKGGATGAVVGGGLGLGFKAAQQVLPLAKIGIQKVTGVKSELAKAFEDAGVSPRLADITQGQTTKTFQNLLGNFPGSRGVIEKATQNQIDDIIKQLAGITKSEGGTIQQAGKMIQEGAETFKGTVKERIGKLYDDLDKFIPSGQAAKAVEVPPIKDLNPTGGLYVDYRPQDRMAAKLAQNITTFDKTANKSPDELITIYRGAPKNQKEIAPGDFITTNFDLAKSYAGSGNILSKRVKASHILDDLNEPLGDEYIYRPDSKKIGAKLEPSSKVEPLSLIKRNELIAKAAGTSGAGEDDLFRILEQYKTASKDVQELKPKSLLQFIKEKGGISDHRGELSTLGVTNKTLPGLLRKEGSAGTSVDDIGEKLWEGGYFSERPTTSEVLDLIDKEMRGQKVFLPSSDLARYDEAANILDQIDQYGIDIASIQALKKAPKPGAELETAGIPTSNLQKLSQDPAIQDVVAVGSGDTAKVLNHFRRILNEQGQISYPRLKIFRSTVGRKLQSPTLGGDERGAIKQIYGALSEDMKEAIVANGGEKGLQAFNKADNAFGRYTDILESKINPLIDAKTPEAVYSMAMSGSKQGGSNIRGIMKTLDPEQKQFVRGTITKKMGLANAGEQDATGEIFSPNKFLTEWNKLSPEAKSNIYDKKQVESIDNLNKVLASIKDTSKARQSSNNLPYLTWFGLGGLTVANPLAGAAAVGGANLTAKMMTNPKFINWLAQAPKVPTREIPKHLRMLSIIASKDPDIQEDILDYLDSITSVGDAQASEIDNIETLKTDLINQKKQYPGLMDGIDPEARAQQIQQRYYR